MLGCYPVCGYGGVPHAVDKAYATIIHRFPNAAAAAGECPPVHWCCYQYCRWSLSTDRLDQFQRRRGGGSTSAGGQGHHDDPLTFRWA